MAKPKTVPVFSFATIERRFRLTPLRLFGSFHPAVTRDKDGRYSIRVLKSETRYGPNVNVTYDYFYCDADGTITQAPRGYAKDYRPGRFDPWALDQAVAKYAAEAVA